MKRAGARGAGAGRSAVAARRRPRGRRRRSRGRRAGGSDGVEPWAARWSGLAEWFVSGEERESRARLLRGRALGTIPQLLTVARPLNERRAGRADRSADFRRLARWFAQAPDDSAPHRLWRVAFGLHSSRHLTVDADPLAERTAAPESASTPWSEARPLRISPQLRRTGSCERRGKPRRVADRTEAKRRLAEIAARQAEETRWARDRLVMDGPVRLSRLGELDPHAVQLFLRLLGDVLATWRPGTVTTVTTSGDGSMEIRLTTLDDGSTAEVRTPDGVFRGPDHLIDIIDLTVRHGDCAATPPSAPAPAPVSLPAARQSLASCGNPGCVWPRRRSGSPPSTTRCCGIRV
ncbi:TIGR02677 family protein [Streptomyces sp. PG2]